MKFKNILTFLIIISCMLLSCHTKKEIINIASHPNDTVIQEENTNNQELKVYKNRILNQNIKTLLCYKEESPQSLPIINLGSDEKLLIQFDDLNEKIQEYYFTIIHCNENWTESDLMQSEYINGFTENRIINYELSFNTIQKFTHYSFTFPNTETQPIISGNYVFKIYKKNGEIVAYKKFMILDKKVSILAEVRKGTLAENRKTKHEVDFSIIHPNIVIADPFSDIKVHIKQNNREDNAITDLLPLFVKNDMLVYDYDEENNFWGNNEFRYFDTKSLRYQSEKIKSITYQDSANHIYLFNDDKRSFNKYSIQPDINGGFLIDSQEGRIPAIEADYGWVHFSIPIEEVPYGEIYLFGFFSEWDIKDEFKLSYNNKKNTYEASVYLKQGYYNYLYALKDSTTNMIDTKFIEGTHYQTRNDYYLYVYYRGVGDRYDRLIGFLKTSSKELF